MEGYHRGSAASSVRGSTATVKRQSSTSNATDSYGGGGARASSSSTAASAVMSLADRTRGTSSTTSTTSRLIYSSPLYQTSYSRLPPIYPPFRFATVEEGLYRGGYPKPRNHRFMKRLNLKTIVSLTPDPPSTSLLEFCQLYNITTLHIRVDKPKEEEDVPFSFSKCAMILSILIDPARHPCYVHCLDGMVVTGLVVCCLRKLQLWAIPAAINEYSRFVALGGGDSVENEHKEFVERFNAEVELAGMAPSIPPLPQAQGKQGDSAAATPPASIISSFTNLSVSSSASTANTNNATATNVLPQPPTLCIPKWLWNGTIPFKKHPSIRLKYPASYNSTTNITNNSSTTSAPANSTPITSSTTNPSGMNTHSANSTTGSSMGTPIGSFSGQAALDALVGPRTIWNSYMHKQAGGTGGPVPNQETPPPASHMPDHMQDLSGLLMNMMVKELPDAASATSTPMGGNAVAGRNSISHHGGSMSARSSFYGGPPVGPGGRNAEYPSRIFSGSSAGSSADGGHSGGGANQAGQGSGTPVMSGSPLRLDRDDRMGRRREATVTTMFIGNNRDGPQSANSDEAEEEHYSLQLDALNLM
ncbi:hypothetical protein HDV05_003810 [Chytridiales sp. JEL 0842]|nr:hypothetical protein HDV05_003810 [Chytridiales sp. JEL 0842]